MASARTTEKLEEIKALLFGDRKSSPISIAIYLTYVCERINGTVYSDNIDQHLIQHLIDLNSEL